MCSIGSLRFYKPHRQDRKKVARRKNFRDGSLKHRKMEVIYEVSFSKRSCHDSPQKELKGAGSSVPPSTVAWEQPSVQQVGAHLGRSTVLGSRTL